MDASTLATVLTALAAAVISYTLQKPYVRVVKMFTPLTGVPDPTLYKLKNAGAATAISVVLQDTHGQPVDLDLKLGQIVRSVDALPAGADIEIRLPNGNALVRVYYENLFGILFHTDLADAGNRFRMVGGKTWPVIHSVPKAIFSELPPHRWRRHG